MRRTNPERSAETRGLIVAAAREMFVANGYAATGTPQIAAAAGVTRGALYHHFADKADLLLEVARMMALEVAEAIERAGSRRRTPFDALRDGAHAYFSAMADGGRAQLLLVEAPAVLGANKLKELSEAAGYTQLLEGLAVALRRRRIPRKRLEAMAEVLSAAFDRAALMIVTGRGRRDCAAALDVLIEALQAWNSKRPLR
ncbi:MAG: TetR/AcrR family transcriptional regulator [Gemmatimonadota bacterium]